MEGFKLKELISKLENNKEFYKNNFAKIKMPATWTSSNYGICFFVKIVSSSNKIVYPALITTFKCFYHCLINNNWQFNIHCENSKQNKTIIFHPSKRKFFFDKKHIIAIIEITKYDGLDIDSFFEIDEHIFENNLETIFSQTYFYSIYYSKNEIQFTEPKILKISDDKIKVSGFHGIPIFNLSNNKIIGIQFKEGDGMVLKEPIKKYLDFLSKSKNEDNDINEISLLYKKSTGLRTKIFGKKFVERYKSKLNIIFDDEEIELVEYLDNNTIEDQIFKIKLVGFKNLDKNIDLSYMFHNCSNLFNIFNKFKNLSMKNITNITYLFDGCSSITFLPDISKWDISKLNDISYIFRNCTSLIELPDISKWDTKNIININGIFCNCCSLKFLPDISKWDTNNITYMRGVFTKCSSLISLPDISNWKVNKVSNMRSIFAGCSSLKLIPDISKWEMYKVLNMKSMFAGCSSLLTLPDISIWKVSNVINMKELFASCKSLLFFPNIQNWNVSNVKDASYMFHKCSSITEIPDISAWDLSSVENITAMFAGCSSLFILPDIYKWKLPKIKFLNSLFAGCYSLSYSPRISDQGNNVFGGCISLLNK